MATSTASPCTASFFTQLLSGNAIVCSQTFQNAQIAQTVQDQADEAALISQNYGADSVTAAVANASAAAQASMAVSDVTDIDTTIANSTVGNPLLNSDCSGIDLSLYGGPCVSSTTLWILGISVAALVLLIFLGDIRALIGR